MDPNMACNTNFTFSNETPLQLLLLLYALLDECNMKPLKGIKVIDLTR